MLGSFENWLRNLRARQNYMFSLSKLVILPVVLMLGIFASIKGGLFPGVEADSPPARDPNFVEREAREALGEKIEGRILFDSRRKGPSFGVYSMKPDGSDLKIEVNTVKHEIFPDPSPDGRYIVFNRTDSLERDAAGEITILDRLDGTETVIGSGTYPSFSSDGSSVYYEVSRSKFMSVAVGGRGIAKEVFPKDNPQFKGRKIVKPRFSLSGNKVYFTSDVGGRWTAWSFDLLKQVATKIGKGCEPVPFSDEVSSAWISKQGVLSKSGIIKHDRDGRKSVLQDAGRPYGHEYFPTLVKDDKFLLFSACPAGQHSHLTANYQIFIRDLSEEKAVRVTFDEFTNRWPKLMKDFDRKPIQIDDLESLEGRY